MKKKSTTTIQDYEMCMYPFGYGASKVWFFVMLLATMISMIPIALFLYWLTESSPDAMIPAFILMLTWAFLVLFGLDACVHNRRFIDDFSISSKGIHSRRHGFIPFFKIQQCIIFESSFTTNIELIIEGRKFSLARKTGPSPKKGPDLEPFGQLLEKAMQEYALHFQELKLDRNQQQPSEPGQNETALQTVKPWPPFVLPKHFDLSIDPDRLARYGCIGSICVYLLHVLSLSSVMVRGVQASKFTDMYAETDAMKRMPSSTILIPEPSPSWGIRSKTSFCEWHLITGQEWAELLLCDPNYSEHCNWDLLEGKHWTQLLIDAPHFAEHCDWSKLSSTDWNLLLCYRPQFQSHRVPCA